MTHSSEAALSVSATSSDAGSPFRPSLTPRRGPGRPRLKPSGPAHHGNRAHIRTRKLPGPLVVPLGSSPSSSLGLSRSSVTISNSDQPMPDRSISAAKDDPTLNVDIYP